MLACPKCHKQYPESMNRCETCNVPLVDSAEPAPGKGAEDLELVELARFMNVSEAEMIRELFEHNNIQTVVKGEIDPIGIASRADTTRLLVEKKDLRQARELYQAYFAGDTAENQWDKDL